MSNWKPLIDNYLQEIKDELDEQKLYLTKLSYLRKLTHFHFENCLAYSKILQMLNFKVQEIDSLEDFPYLPISIFKTLDLVTLEPGALSEYKVLHSSGTTSSKRSKIFLSKQNSREQSKALSWIVQSLLGPIRKPMLIIDSEGIIGNKNEYSARGAAVQGFSMFGINHQFALDESMNLNYSIIDSFLKENGNREFIVLGFTSVLWNNFLQEIIREKRNYDFSNGIVIHGGGWKKLQDVGVDNAELRDSLKKTLGINRVVNYYGMAEQTGSIFFECNRGFFHTNPFNDIQIRNYTSFNVNSKNEPGLIQVFSLLPTSYPGHSILTEDQGIIPNFEECPCGQMGKPFKVLGRIPNVEMRGCSDVI